MGIKRLDVLFVQETHSTKNYENEWKECSGDVILSHESINSAGWVLFSLHSVIIALMGWTVDKSIGKAQYDRIDRNHSEPHPAPKAWPVRMILGLTLL